MTNRADVLAASFSHRDPVFRQFVIATGYPARILIDQTRRVLLVPPSCLLGPPWFEKSYGDSEEKVGQFETMAKGTYTLCPEYALGTARLNGRLTS